MAKLTQQLNLSLGDMGGQGGMGGQVGMGGVGLQLGYRWVSSLVYVLLSDFIFSL